MSSLDDGEIRQVRYEETDHYQSTRSLLEAPERYFRHLLADKIEIAIRVTDRAH